MKRETAYILVGLIWVVFVISYNALVPDGTPVEDMNTWGELFGGLQGGVFKFIALLGLIGVSAFILSKARV